MFGAKGCCYLLAYFAFSQKCLVHCGLDAEQGETMCMGHVKCIFPSLAGGPWQQQLNAQFSSLTPSSPPRLYFALDTGECSPLCLLGTLVGTRVALAEGQFKVSSKFSLILPRTGFHFKWLFFKSSEGLKLCHMRALVKMEDLLSSYRVQKRVTEGQVSSSVNPVSCSRAPPCLGEQTCHPHTPTRIKGWDFQSSRPRRHKICLFLCWLGIRFLPDLSPGRHTLSSKVREVTLSGFDDVWHCHSTRNKSIQYHDPRGSRRGANSAESHSLLPAESCAGRCCHCSGGLSVQGDPALMWHQPAVLPLHRCLLAQRKLAARTAERDQDYWKGKRWRKESKAKIKSFLSFSVSLTF